MSRWASSPTFAAFQHGEFRYLIASNLTYFLGLMGQMVLRAILAWNLTQSPLSLSYVSLALGVPMLLLAPLGGVIADRYERRRLIMWAQSLILLSESFVLILLMTESLQFWQLMVTTVITGSAFTVISPARQAIVVNVVPREHLNNALALAAASLNLAKVLGPAAMGIIVPYLGMVGSYAVSLSIYAIGLLTMFGVSRCPVEARSSRSALGGMREGLQFVVAHRPLRLVFMVGFIPAFFGLPFQYLLVVFAEEVWMTGTRGFGFLQAAAGLGAVVGTMLVARQGAHGNTSRTLLISLLLFGLLLMGFSLCQDFWFALLLVMLSMACANIFITKNTIAVQLLTTDAMRGRMSSVIFMTISLTPLGTVPLAWLAETLGAPHAVLVIASLMLVLGLLAFMVSPTLRNLDQFITEAVRDDPTKRIVSEGADDGLAS